MFTYYRMNIYAQTTDYIKSLSKRLTDAKKADAIKNHILNLNCADSTKAGLITKVKAYIKDEKLFKDESNINLLNAPEIYNRIFKKVNETRENIKPIDIDMDVIKKIISLKNIKTNDTHNVYALYAYLLATSGLRTNEIWDNSFEFVNHNTIKPKRLSKMPDEAYENAVINLLIPAKEWLNFYDILTNLIKIRKTKYGSAVFTGIKRILAPIHPELSGHSLRKIYLAYHLHILKTDPDKLPSINTKNLLNHTGESTSTYYNGAVKINGDVVDVIDRTDYSKYTIVKIKEVLKSKNISFKSNAKKYELINLL